MRIIWVAPDGSDLTGDGSYDRPYQTLHQARAVFVSGDQIRLQDGLYTPDDALVFNDLEGSIFADNPLGATIKPSQIATSIAVIEVNNSSRFSLLGLNILQPDVWDDNARAGILATHVTDFVVHTCAVSDFEVPSGDTTTVGIAVSGYGRIENCDIHNLSATEDYLYGIHTDGYVDIINCSVYALSGSGACAVRPISLGGAFHMANWTNINSDLLPDVDCLRSIGSSSKRWKDGFFCGKLTVDGGIDPTFLGLTPIDPSLVIVPNSALFVDNTDSDKLKFKTSSGGVITLENANTTAPAVYNASTLGNYPLGLPDNTTDNITVTAPTTGTQVLEGLVLQVVLTDSSALGSGDIRVEMFNDQARSDKIYDRVFNLADTPLIDTIPAHFKSDGIAGAGAIYVDITNNAGVTGTFIATVRAASVLPSGTPPAGSGSGINTNVVGDGLSFDGTRLNFATTGVTSGFEFTGTSPNSKARVKVGTHLQRTAAGVDVASTVVVSTGNQNVAGVKRFTSSAFGMTPAGTPGPPGAGAYLTGDLYLDSNRVLWMCSSSGSPGDWQLYGWAYSQGIDVDISALEDNADYTGEVPAGSYEDVPITVTGNRGVIRKLVVWATDPAGIDDWPATDLDQAFRVNCYATHNRYGREQIWSVLGQARKTYLTGALTGGVDKSLPVNDVNIAGPDDLIRMRAKAGPGEEYARITVRDAAAVEYDVDIEVINDFLANDPVMIATEFVELPFICDSAVTPQTIFLRFYNDGATNVKFGYQMDVESIGGGATL